ncbi:hypothetical protein B7486_55390, partial [cyanobacterium TDX16]
MDVQDNPFRPGAGTSPPALEGRDELIDAFGVAARRALSGRPGKSLMPIGLRGVGKTVLLNRFAEIGEAEGMALAFIEAPESGDLRTLLAAKLRSVLLRLDRTGPTRAVLTALRVLKTFTLQLPDGSRLAIDVDPLVGQADSGLLAEDITDLLVAVGHAAAAKDLGVLIALDEVQYLSNEELGALITAIHRTTQLDLPVLLVGAGLPQLPGLAGEAKSYSERLFDFPEIGSLPMEDAADALTNAVWDLGVQFDDDALQEIVRESHGYPYFLQEWGYHVWNQAASSPVTVDDV